ncbi:MAG: PKD domain-containing protein, partial [Pseudomonadota bacterium]
GQSGAGISFQASATTTGCSSQPSYQWSFGDGTQNSSEQNPSHTYASAGTYTWTLTTTVGSGSTMIDTVAGGLGEGNPARQSPFGTPSAIARDPQNRGVYVADSIGSGTLIRFINTGSSAVTIAGRTIAPGTVRAIAGGGQEIADNVPALAAELGGVTGLAVSGDGNLVYIASQIDAAVRAVNVSDSSQTVGTQTVGAGRIGTLVSNLGTQLGGIAVNASTGEVFLSDASSGTNKVFRITPQGQSSAFAGNGSTSTEAGDPFQGGAAVNIPLLQPRAVTIAANGDVLIADTGHGRVIRVDGGGTATLVNQFTINQTNLNPYPSGIALFGGNAYVANGNQQTIVRVTGGVARIAGLLDPNSNRGLGISCDYSASSCGDGGPASGASFNMLGSTAAPPVAGIAGDASGLYVLD